MYRSYEQLGIDENQEQRKDVLQVRELQNSQEKRDLIATTRVVCVDIYADWCEPCKQTAPDYALIASNYSNSNCAVVKQQLDRMDAQERNSIHGIPVFQFFVEGKKVDEIVGADIQKVDEYLRKYTTKETSSLSQSGVYTRNSIRQNRSNIPRMDQ